MAQKVEQDHEVQMARSDLYKAAKYSIALHEMLKNVSEEKGLEGWVQAKITKAADYMSSVFHNMDYEQKFADQPMESKNTPYKDTLNKNQKSQKKVEDKETKESGLQYYTGVKKYGKDGMKAIQSAAGKGANHEEIGKIKDKYLKDDEIDEGLKDTLQKLAAAGVIVGTMAGAGAINTALDNSVPAVKAMNTAYDMAVDAGNDELAKMIKNDIGAVKVRLSSGKDLNFIKSMQDKYSKFMPTEGIAYESKLAVLLNQRLK